MMLEDRIYYKVKEILDGPIGDRLGKWLTHPLGMIVTLFTMQILTGVTLPPSGGILILFAVAPLLMLAVVPEPDNSMEYPSKTAVETMIARPRKNWVTWILLGLLVKAALVWGYPPNQMSTAGQYIYVVIIAPVYEELIFRELIYRRGKRLMNPLLAGFLVNLAFAILHPTSSILTFVRYILHSFVYNTVYDRTGEDVRATIILHSIYNLMVII